MLVNCGNDYYTEYFDEVCNHLESGETVQVYINCIGHTRNNYTQEAYKQALVKKYGDRLEVKCSNGVCSYHYEYKLK